MKVNSYNIWEMVGQMNMPDVKDYVLRFHIDIICPQGAVLEYFRQQ